MAAELIYITGGVRSGKSRFAQEEATRIAGPSGSVAFIATAGLPPDDARWAQRIERHRRERPDHWNTIEAGEDLDDALGSVSGDARVALIDCLTLWVGRLLSDASDQGGQIDEFALGKLVGERVVRLLDAVANVPGSVIIVTNEVGSGVTPPTEIGNLFADALGEVNQRIAAASDRAYLLVSGFPMRVK